MTLQPTLITTASIDRCISHLRDGRLVIIPTDTVYGVAADATNDDAVRGLYAAKGKDYASPLQLLFANDAAMVARFALLSHAARTLIEALGPGGWTIITTIAPGWDSPALAGGSTVGVRIPDAKVVDDIVRLLGQPLAATSANRHGGLSPVSCAEAIDQLGGACAIALDGGATPRQLDSTVIDCSVEGDLRILREGAIDRHTIARILKLSDIPVLRSVRP